MIIYIKRITIQPKNITMTKFFMKDFCIKFNKKKMNWKKKWKEKQKKILNKNNNW